MIVHVLGSAAGGGVPQWNCGCENCMRARRSEAPLRTQSSIAVSGDHNEWVLVNASVDLPRHLAATRQLWPGALRANPFRAVLLTDANVDHTAGLGELRQNPDPLVVVSSDASKRLLADQRAYERFDRLPHRWVVAENGAEVAAEVGGAIGSSLEIHAVEMPGLLPGFAGRARAAGAVLAYVFRDRARGSQVLVAPIHLDLTPELVALIEQCDAAFLDGTFYGYDELAAGGFMGKESRRLGHAPVGGADGTLSRIAGLSNRRVFVHINNTNPMLDYGSSAYAAVKSAGCEVAEDGFAIELQ